MNLMKIKLKIANHMLTNQRYLAILTSLLVNLAKIIPNNSIKIKIYDLYLRFNFNAEKSSVILRRVVELSKKAVLSSIENETEQSLIRSIVLKKYISEKMRRNICLA